MVKPNIFRDYDIRAIIPDELDMEGVERIAKATAHYFKPQSVSIGYDARLTGEEISKRLVRIFLKTGAKVTSLGQISTDMMSFASGKFGFDLSIMVTASHNPSEHNGFKMATKGGVSVSGATGFYQIRDLALSDSQFPTLDKKGSFKELDLYDDWVDFCLSFIKIENLKPLKVVVDAGNGIGGKLFGHQSLLRKLPIEMVPLYLEPDGSFPHHIPNPLKMENLTDLIALVKKEKADLGVALDGDGDRITFITEKGKFVSGTITTALIAESLLKKKPDQMVLYNAICGKIVPETVTRLGGKSKRVRVGYSLIKQEMKKTKAVFAGEHSCHFFYRDVFNSEASLLSFLLILEFLSQTKQPFSQMISAYDKYARSGELNFEVKDKMKMMKAIEKVYRNKAQKIDWLDGVTLWFKNYWANIRPSNTQPLLRLNIEADDEKILREKEREFIQLIESLEGKSSQE